MRTEADLARNRYRLKVVQLTRGNEEQCEFVVWKRTWRINDLHARGYIALAEKAGYVARAVPWSEFMNFYRDWAEELLADPLRDFVVLESAEWAVGSRLMVLAGGPV